MTMAKAPDIREIRTAAGKLLASAEYRDGLLNGTNKVWNEQGVLVERSSFVDGVRHGFYETWWDSGQPKEKGTYERGNRIGIYQWFDSDGSLVSEHDYTSYLPQQPD
jgi:antitoxin component YwqK of YwqJK toxin-antitoxin module